LKSGSPIIATILFAVSGVAITARVESGRKFRSVQKAWHSEANRCGQEQQNPELRIGADEGQTPTTLKQPYGSSGALILTCTHHLAELGGCTIQMVGSSLPC
jgi:hypothetical protein